MRENKRGVKKRKRQWHGMADRACVIRASAKNEKVKNEENQAWHQRHGESSKKS